MTTDSLSRHTCKDLAQMAKKRGVQGWHSMRKDQLVQALLKAARGKTPVSKNGAAKSGRRQSGGGKSTGSPRTQPARRAQTAAKSKSSSKSSPAKKAPRRLVQAKNRMRRVKNLAFQVKADAGSADAKDRLIVMVRDAYWLHAYWEVTRQSVQRAEAAMGQDWHAARPVLRLLQVTENGTSSNAETMVRDIEIHGGVNNWYIDVQESPKSYRVDIGYATPGGKMFVLARSNVVRTPKPGSCDAIDENWNDVAENFEKIYALSGGFEVDNPSVELQELFEERLRRPMGSPVVARYGAGAEGLMERKQPFFFELEAELIVYGSTEPSAHVTLQGDPVQVRADGTFTVRFSMPNCRQVIPAVALSGDGIEQRTVVLAVERNTKVMEPLIRDAAD